MQEMNKMITSRNDNGGRHKNMLNSLTSKLGNVKGQFESRMDDNYHEDKARVVGTVNGLVSDLKHAQSPTSMDLKIGAIAAAPILYLVGKAALSLLTGDTSDLDFVDLYKDTDFGDNYRVEDNPKLESYDDPSNGGNGDGIVDGPEYGAYLNDIPDGEYDPQAHRLVHKDTPITLIVDEAAYQEMDVNQDGNISRDELPSDWNIPDHRPVEILRLEDDPEMFAKYDIDGDGEWSNDEFRTYALHEHNGEGPDYIEYSDTNLAQLRVQLQGLRPYSVQRIEGKE